MKVKNSYLAVLAAGLTLGLTGCASHESKSTPIVMAFNASTIDFSKLDSMKHATICGRVDDPNKDLTLKRAATAAGVSHVVYADTSVKVDTGSGRVETCLTVYGE